MIVVPANNVILICIWFLSYTVIHYGNTLFTLNLANVRLGNPPQVC